MLANDSVTLAVEIPIWLTALDIDALSNYPSEQFTLRNGILVIRESGPK